MHHRGAAFGLDDRQLWDPVNQPHVEHLFEALIYAQRPQPAADGLDIPIRSLPAKLFNNLVCNCFHRFARRDGTGAPVEHDIFAFCEIAGDLFGLVIVSANPDDFGAKQGRLRAVWPAEPGWS